MRLSVTFKLVSLHGSRIKLSADLLSLRLFGAAEAVGAKSYANTYLNDAIMPVSAIAGADFYP